MDRELRRRDRAMSPEDAWRLLERAYVGRLGTVGPDGWPYVVPKMFVAYDGCVCFHGTAAPGHTRANVEADPRVCFEVDEPGPVFPTGTASQCETSVAFESVVLYGACDRVEDAADRTAVLERLMAKYADPAWARPPAWSMLDATAVYRIRVQRITGKRRTLAVPEPWREQFQSR